eukprot:4141088-Pyramimonas_sp.AAC.1
MALYENSRMVVQFNNSDPYYIQLCRGIKQGCPLSGLLFSLCFDPVVRRLQRVSLQDAVTFNVFADDLAATASDLAAVLPRICKIMVQSGRATGLSLKRSASSSSLMRRRAPRRSLYVGGRGLEFIVL